MQFIPDKFSLTEKLISITLVICFECTEIELVLILKNIQTNECANNYLTTEMFTIKCHKLQLLLLKCQNRGCKRMSNISMAVRFMFLLFAITYQVSDWGDWNGVSDKVQFS